MLRHRQQTPATRLSCQWSSRLSSRRLVVVASTPQRQQDPRPRTPNYPPPPRPPPGYGTPPPAYGPPYAEPQPASGPAQPVSDASVRDGAGLGGYAKALVAASFVLGLGLGVFFDSEVVLTPANVSSTEIIDRATPNADICLANGYSASVLSMNVFVTYNPFNVYISQPQVKGGCVLRRANVGLLEREKLVTPHDVDICKQRMNTFAYVGDLKSEPEVACVYHSEEAENQYLTVLGNRQKMSQLLMQQPSTPASQAPAAPAS